jgi:hypothetical protein
MDEPERDSVADDSPVGAGEYYLLICLVSLVLMVLSLSELHLGERLYAPYACFGLGVLCLVFQLSSGPPLLLLSMSILMLTQPSRALALNSDQGVSSTVGYEFVLIASALAYTVAFYRRLSLESGIFPADSRKLPANKPGGKPVSLPRVCRPAHLATTGELFVLALTTLVYCLGGYVLWFVLLLPPPSTTLGFELATAGEWRLLLLCWVVAGIGVTFAVIGTYVGRAAATPLQNLLYLQDQLWSETWSEQGLVSRLFVRARLRNARRKEKK